MRLRDGARVAVIGAGPGGLVAAKHALEAGFDVTVFEASDDLGGQWNTAAAHSGIWPGMRTNTSRAMTAFSDLPAAADHPLHPAADADPRLPARVRRLVRGDRADQFQHPGPRGLGRRGWWTASPSTRWSRVRPVPRARCCRTGSTASTASCCTPSTTRVPIISAAGARWSTATASAGSRSPPTSRRSRRWSRRSASRATSCQKIVDGVSSDWQWYTALRRPRAPAAVARGARRGAAERVLRVAGDPAVVRRTRAQPATSWWPGIRCARTTSTQVRDGQIVCRPGDRRGRRTPGDLRRRHRRDRRRGRLRNRLPARHALPRPTRSGSALGPT